MNNNNSEKKKLNESLKQKSSSSAEILENSDKNSEKKRTSIFRKYTKKEIEKIVKKYIVLTLASLILSLGVVFFMDPLRIVSGGLTGIAIVIDTLIDGDWLDIILYVGEGSLIILSFIFLGKKVTFKSLYACIMVPVFTTLLTRVIPTEGVINIIYGGINDQGVLNFSTDLAYLLMGGLTGSMLTGISVGLAFSVGGSTGGVDTIVLIFKKYFPMMKESVLCFVIDAFIIIAGILTTFSTAKEIESYNFIISFVNIVSAVVCAGTIEALYMISNSSVTFTIISEKWEEINKYIIEVLDRGSTVYKVIGGYTNEEKIEIKTTVSKKQAEILKEEILSLDKSAFMILTKSKGVFGEGFQSRFSDE